MDSLRGGRYSSGMGDTGVLDNSVGAVEGVVAGDAPCRRCGYNLRTLPVAGVCPECAWPVAESVRSEKLRFADVRWLRQVRWGVRLLLVSVAGPLALNIAFFVVFNVAAALFNPPIDIHLVDKWTVFTGFVIVLVRLAFVVGVFLVAVEEPATFVSRQVRNAAWMARAFALVAEVVNMTGRVIVSLGAVFTWPLALQVIVPILKPGSFCFLSVVLRAIARRAKHARLAYWTLVVVSVALGLSVANAFVMFGVGSGWPLVPDATFGAGSLINLALVCGVPGCYVAGAILLQRYHSVLTRAIADAEQRAKA